MALWNNEVSRARSSNLVIHEKRYDYIIVGGGSAGCVVASRLSEDIDKHVLLVEAGPDVVPGREPADILSIHADSAFNPSYRWSVPSYSRNVQNLPRETAHQARVLGGGSSLMGMLSLRGVPDDYDGWAALGATGWAWSDVLPWFCKLENDLDFGGELHGDSGPVNIRRNPKVAWPPMCLAMERYATRNGLPYVADMNADFREGLASVPLASSLGGRQSSSICYLDETIRQRRNLHVMTNAEVVGLSQTNRAFDGAYVKVDSTLRHVQAGMVILSAGALLSPALLMRAGIGAGSALQNAGIPVLVDNPGVGCNLRNHPMLFLTGFLPHGAREADAAVSSVNCCLRYSSGDGNPRADMYILGLNRTARHPLGGALAALQSYLLKPNSTGFVELQGSDPQQQPLVHFDLLSDPLDLSRAARSLRDMAALATSPEFETLNAEFFAVKFSARLRSLNQPTLRNLLISAAALRAIDVFSPAKALLKKAMPGGPNATDILAMGQDDLEVLAQEYVAPAGHHVGTCRMGSASDLTTVVDPQGRVNGVNGLRVIDASIMPNIPRGNTNLPTLMIAEKLSNDIRHGS